MKFQYPRIPNRNQFPENGFLVGYQNKVRSTIWLLVSALINPDSIVKYIRQEKRNK